MRRASASDDCSFHCVLFSNTSGPLINRCLQYAYTDAVRCHQQNLSAIVSFIFVNGHYITVRDDGTWKTPRSLSQSLAQADFNETSSTRLRVRVQFRRDVDASIITQTTAQLIVRRRNTSSEFHTLSLAPQPPSALETELELPVPPLCTTAGPCRLLLRLENRLTTVRSVLLWRRGPSRNSFNYQESALLSLGPLQLSTALNATTHRSISSSSLSLLQRVWHGRVLPALEVLRRCDIDQELKELLETRFLWGEVLIAAFSVTYCSAVCWLGPLDFTPWQRRFYHASCVSSALFHAVFLAWMSQALALCVAFPLALSISLIYFGAFNLTNVLILLEKDLPEEQASEYDSERDRRRDRRDGSRRSALRGIPLPSALRDVTRVEMIGYKKARYC
ncbi:hypothetical protein PINS_up008859 [Pythium insidiosum]|nr:hypothetical protein PINS_up008859 [Pythium insidiosum]